jgi:hypothetical protein
MKYFILFIITISFISCSRQQENLDYPADKNEISNIFLDKPDKATNEESASIQELSKTEIEILIKTLVAAKEVGPMKFMPKYYIIFETKAGKTLKLKVAENHIKGYESDLTYEINEPDFLKKFGQD